jgi:hypothetical protein
MRMISTAGSHREPDPEPVFLATGRVEAWNDASWSATTTCALWNISNPDTALNAVYVTRSDTVVEMYYVHSTPTLAT